MSLTNDNQPSSRNERSSDMYSTKEVPEILNSPNLLKRKKEDCQEEQLEAEIKRVALDDNTEEEEREEEPREKESQEEDITMDDKANVLTQDNDYVHLRMLCLVKQASMVVGPGGKKINMMKENTKTRINISDNIRGVQERVIYVRGSCENVAKAFGLIVRAINDEDEGKSNEHSLPLTVNLLVPHHMMGVLIGRQGTKLREIEEMSAARLMAGPNTLPMSNDRVLSLTGVADAIHIATYYIGQTITENKSKFKSKSIFYTPSTLHSVLVNSYGIGFQHQQHHQYHPKQNRRFSANGKRNSYQSNITNTGAVSTIFPAHTATSPDAPYTPFSPNYQIPNVRVSETIQTTASLQPHAPQQIATLIQQDIFIDDNYVGNVIGKGGKNINIIKETSGCSIQIGDPVPGLKERKLTIVGTPMGNQTAIVLINNRIEMDRRSNALNRQTTSG